MEIDNSIEDKIDSRHRIFIKYLNMYDHLYKLRVMITPLVENDEIEKKYQDIFALIDKLIILIEDMEETELTECLKIEYEPDIREFKPLPIDLILHNHCHNH